MDGSARDSVLKIDGRGVPASETMENLLPQQHRDNLPEGPAHSDERRRRREKNPVAAGPHRLSVESRLFVLVVVVSEIILFFSVCYRHCRLVSPSLLVAWCFFFSLSGYAACVAFVYFRESAMGGTDFRDVKGSCSCLFWFSGAFSAENLETTSGEAETSLLGGRFAKALCASPCSRSFCDVWSDERRERAVRWTKKALFCADLATWLAKSFKNRAFRRSDP